MGCWIVLTERGDWDGNTYPIINVQAFKVDGISIKADTFYKLKKQQTCRSKIAYETISTPRLPNKIFPSTCIKNCRSCRR